MPDPPQQQSRLAINPTAAILNIISDTLLSKLSSCQAGREITTPCQIYSTRPKKSSNLSTEKGCRCFWSNHLPKMMQKVVFAAKLLWSPLLNIFCSLPDLQRWSGDSVLPHHQLNLGVKGPLQLHHCQKMASFGIYPFELWFKIIQMMKKWFNLHLNDGNRFISVDDSKWGQNGIWTEG